MSADPRAPAEVWPMASFMAEEMEARGWDAFDVAERMPGNYMRNVFVVSLLLAVQSESLIFDEDESQRLGTAFDVDPQFFLNLHRSWLDHPAARQEFKCPEHLFAGLNVPRD